MNYLKTYRLNEFSELINVSVKTLQRWDREGILIAKRTPTGRRYYTESQYLEFMGSLTINLKCEDKTAYNEVMKAIEGIEGVELC